MPSSEKAPDDICYAVVKMMKHDQKSVITSDALVIDLEGKGWLNPGSVVGEPKKRPDGTIDDSGEVIVHKYNNKYFVNVTANISGNLTHQAWTPQARPELPSGANWIPVESFKWTEPDDPAA